MTEFTKEFIKGQLEKFHNSTSDDWLTDCWNNYGLALEFIEELYDEIHLHEVWHRTYKDEVTELEAEQRWIPVSTPPEETGYYIVVWQTTCGNGELYSDYGYFKKEEGWGKVNVKFWRPLPQPPKDGE